MTDNDNLSPNEALAELAAFLTSERDSILTTYGGWEAVRENAPAYGGYADACQHALDILARVAPAPVMDREAMVQAIAGGTITVPTGYGVLQHDDAEAIVDAILALGHPQVAGEPGEGGAVERAMRHIETQRAHSDPARAVDTSRLRAVWAALGCEQNPEDFREDVRQGMWAQALQSIDEYVGGVTRVHRENLELTEALREARSANPSPQTVTTGAELEVLPDDTVVLVGTRADDDGPVAFLRDCAARNERGECGGWWMTGSDTPFDSSNLLLPATVLWHAPTAPQVRIAIAVEQLEDLVVSADQVELAVCDADERYWLVWSDQDGDIHATSYRHEDDHANFDPSLARLDDIAFPATVLTPAPPVTSGLDELERVLGISLWNAPSFRSDVRIDFDESGQILEAELLPESAKEES